ncbi:MAG: nicotinate (nicotinamide) nucleotide adenylyltransferase [Ruminococcaceae bacterium]|nr:nicotinate (nicotinamide) nucleotide adenylyltransferase [Oscillospiraceae bacterium]
MGKIGLLGGTFDPIHNAHLFMGQLCADTLGLDKVIFIPSGITPHKDAVTKDAKRRYEMVKLAIDGNPLFCVSDYETNKTTPSYSDETVEYFKKLYPDDEIVFILGEDSLDYVDTWHNAPKLLTSCSFAVISRGGFESDINKKINSLKEQFSTQIYNITSPELEISSRAIRNMLGEGKSAKYLVPDVVLDYIKEQGMYKNGK